MEEPNLEKKELLVIDNEGLTKEKACEIYRVGFIFKNRVSLLENENGLKYWGFTDTKESLKDWDKKQKEIDESGKDNPWYNK